MLDFPLMVPLPAIMTVCLSIWVTQMLRRRRWHWIAVLLVSIAAVVILVGFGYYGALWVFRIGPAGTDPNGFNIGGAIFFYGLFLPLSVLVSGGTMIVRRLFAK